MHSIQTVGGEPRSSTTFCCVQCRLLQSPTATCAECGGSMTAPVELVRELLYYRDMRFVRARDWGLITAFLAGSSLAMPILAPFAVGSMLVLALHKLRSLRKRPAIAGIDMPPIATAPGSTTIVGTARRLRGSIRSLVGDATVLVETAVVHDRRGAVLLRRTEATPFLLDVDGTAPPFGGAASRGRASAVGALGPVLITGVARFTAASLVAERTQLAAHDPRLARMGVPDDLAVAGELEVRSIGEGGTGLAVTGVLEEEAVAELAFHRDNGTIPVMRGRAGAPILLEDRRLIAAVPAR